MVLQTNHTLINKIHRVVVQFYSISEKTTHSVSKTHKIVQKRVTNNCTHHSIKQWAVM